MIISSTGFQRRFTDLTTDRDCPRALVESFLGRNSRRGWDALSYLPPHPPATPHSPLPFANSPFPNSVPSNPTLLLPSLTPFLTTTPFLGFPPALCLPGVALRSPRSPPWGRGRPPLRTLLKHDRLQDRQNFNFTPLGRSSGKSEYFLFSFLLIIIIIYHYFLLFSRFIFQFSFPFFSFHLCWITAPYTPWLSINQCST